MRYEIEADSPSEKALRLTLSIAKDLKPDNEALSEWLSDYVAQHAGRIANDVTLVTRFFRPDQKLLDVGCVPPIFALAVNRLGYEISGIDLKPDRFSAAARLSSLRLIECDIESENFPCEDQSVDGVILNEVFEHLRINPIHTLNEVRRVMRSGAVLMLSTPNLLSVNRLHRLFRTGKLGPDIFSEFAKLRDLGHMGHVREYTVDEVVDFLKQIGFTPELVIYRGAYKKDSIAAEVSRFIPSLRPFFTVVCR